MDIIPLVSILLEAVIAAVALFSVFSGRLYMAGFAVTFGIYVYYDLARHYAWQTSEQLLSVMFLFATIAALSSIIAIVRHK